MQHKGDHGPKGREGYSLRRTILIATSSIFLICTGLWTGGIIGVGALAAPAAFQELSDITRDGGPAAGLVVGAALTRLNTVSVVFLSIMLVAAIFELFYRRRRAAVRLLVLRALIVAAALLLTLYLSLVMMPVMQAPGAQRSADAFARMHSAYKNLAWLQVLLGALAIILTSAANIGPRRDGGHPRVPVD